MNGSLKSLIQEITKTNDGIFQARVISLNPLKICMVNDDKNMFRPVISEHVRNIDLKINDHVYVLVIKNKYFILDRT